MKLVEILAKQLKGWAVTTVCYAQDKGGSAYPWTAIPEFSCGRWTSHEGCDAIDHNFKADLIYTGAADDHHTSVVTKEMWETEKAKMDVQNTPIEAESFNPIYCRDRIKEIDSLVESLEEERVSHVQALEDEGFALISAVLLSPKVPSLAPVEDMSDWRNWKVGDLLECVSHNNKWSENADIGGIYKLEDKPEFDDENGLHIYVSGWFMTPNDFKFHSRPQ